MAYQDVLAKYDRAQKHIDDFKCAVDLFRDSQRDSVGVKLNEQTGEATYYIKSIPTVPTDISLILGDALHNLRSTLDHLAHAVVGPTTEKAIKGTYLPIGNSANDYRGLANRYIQGARQPCRQIFDRIKPYKDGGSGHTLWQLHKLDIIDKHRLLLTMSFAPSDRTLTPSESELVNTKFNRFRNLQRISLPHWMVNDASAPAFPLYEGQIFLTVPAAEAQHNIRFSFDVALYEPDIVELTPALPFLTSVASAVSTIINELESCATIH